ncbi:MAG: type II toxin-antitoxin system ParD family antitoxin [Caulobacteraceae bacterium]
MNVSLTPELEARVSRKVDQGLYNSASEVVRERLRLLFVADDARIGHLAELNNRIQLGLDELARGEGVDGNEARLRAMARFSAKGA